MKRAALARASIFALAIMLAGCGGGGGGVNSGGSTPPPPGPTPSPGPSPTPPPTTANADLIEPLLDERFTNDAVLGNVTFPKSGAPLTATAGPVTLTITYISATDSYTVTDGTRTQTFRQSNIDPTLSNAVVTTYVITNGNVSDSLILTKAGTGPGQTRYVAAGYWQRATDGASSVNGLIDAFTYGVETPDANLPRSGAASYDVSLIGVETREGGVVALAGDGVLNVDFMSGGMAGRGQYSKISDSSPFPEGDYSWQTYAVVNSATNSFSGTIQLDYSGEGSLQGRFYGPGGAEVGAAWSTNQSSGFAAVGTLHGARGDTPVNQVTQLSAPESSAFYRPISASVRAGINGSGVLSNPQAGADLIAIYVPQYGNYAFYGSGGRFTQPLPFRDGELVYEIWPYGNNVALRAGQQLERRNGQMILDSFVYGFGIQFSDMPRIGTGHYRVDLRGGVAAAGSGLRTLLGFGVLTADFADGAISTDGDYTIYDRPPVDNNLGGAAVTDTGSWTGSAQLGASSSAFSGSFRLDGGTDYSGDMNGQFFGGAANDVGAVVQLENAAGAQVSGYLVGIKDEQLTTANTPLADLPGQTKLDHLTTTVNHVQSSDRGRGQPSFDSRPYDVYFDPNSATERLRITYASYYDTVLAKVGNAEYSAADSNSAVRVYKAPFDAGYLEPGQFELREHVFDGRGGRIALSYTGLAALRTWGVTGRTPDQTTTLHAAYFIPYGNATTTEAMPQSGSASYAGVVVGLGGTYSDENTQYYNLTGTSTLNVDFGAASMTSTLSVSGVNVDNGTGLNFGNYQFAGNLAVHSGTRYNSFNAEASGPNYAGYFAGGLFGPHAEEFGATFNIDVRGANGIPGAFLNGATVGRKTSP